MSKKSRFRGPFGKWHGKRAKTGCWNLNSSTFTIFIGHCEDNSVAKSHSWWYAKYSDCLWTHWLPMTSILFLVETIYCNIFRCNYLWKKKHFFHFFLHSRNFHLILNIFKKEDDRHSWCIFELRYFEKGG